VVGTRSILRASHELCGRDPELERIGRELKEGQRYSVLKLWLDRDTPRSRTLPVFVITERERVLDAITFYHHVTKDAARWVEQNPGHSVIELHCYAVPEDLTEEEVREAFMAELHHFFPELEGAGIVHEAFQIRRDFPAFHVGQYAGRPTHRSGIPGLYFAGDWVKLPIPAMLMEAACTSGVLVANDILGEEGLRSHPVYAVPSKGALAGLPRKPDAMARP
jgi:isorenieratene synthase